MSTIYTISKTKISKSVINESTQNNKTEEMERQ